MTSRALRSLRLTSSAIILAVGLASCSDDGSVGPRPPKTLSITGGAGSGRVTSTDGKIDCQLTNGVAIGPRCSATIDSGTVTTLTAVAAAGEEFVAWTGDCSGKTCQLTVTRDMSASPRFVGPQGTLTVALTTPNADDGAVMFDISGPTILGIAPAEGIELVESRYTLNGWTTSRIVARGNLTSTAIAQITVRGIDVDGTYTTGIFQVAGRASAGYKLRSDLSAYRVTVRK